MDLLEKSQRVYNISSRTTFVRDLAHPRTLATSSLPRNSSSVQIRPKTTACTSLSTPNVIQNNCNITHSITTTDVYNRNSNQLNKKNGSSTTVRLTIAEEPGSESNANISHCPNPLRDAKVNQGSSSTFSTKSPMHKMMTKIGSTSNTFVLRPKVFPCTSTTASLQETKDQPEEIAECPIDSSTLHEVAKYSQPKMSILRPKGTANNQIPNLKNLRKSPYAPTAVPIKHPIIKTSGNCNCIGKGGQIIGCPRPKTPVPMKAIGKKISESNYFIERKSTTLKRKSKKMSGSAGVLSSRRQPLAKCNSEVKTTEEVLKKKKLLKEYHDEFKSKQDIDREAENLQKIRYETLLTFSMGDWDNKLKRLKNLWSIKRTECCGDDLSDMKAFFNFHGMDNAVMYLALENNTNWRNIGSIYESHAVSGLDNVINDLITTDQYGKVRRRFWGRTFAFRALNRQWLSYNVNILRGRRVTEQNILDFEMHLERYRFFGGHCRTMSDTLLYFTLYPYFKQCDTLQKERHYNLSRWFRLMQTDEQLVGPDEIIHISHTSQFHPDYPYWGQPTNEFDVPLRKRKN